MAGLAVVLAAAAAALGSPALFAVAVGVLLVTAGGGLAVALAAGRLTVTRTIGAREVQENTPILVRFHVRGPSWLPVRFELEDQSGKWRPIGTAAELELRVGRRGAHWLAPSRLRLRDALGIFDLRLLSGRDEPVLILPAPEAPERALTAHSAVRDDPEPDGLSPYIPGDRPARVHWPALARGAGLQVRRSAPSPSGPPLIVVDAGGAPSPQALDWMARTAAGWILAFARDGACHVLLPGDDEPTTVTGADGSWPAIHRRLATLGSGPPGGAHPWQRAAATVLVPAAGAPAALPPAPPLPRGVLPRLP